MANVVVPQIANVLVPPETIIKKVNDVIAKYDNTSAINLNKLIDGSSIKHPNNAKAIIIQDLVKQINRSVLKMTYIFFSSSIKNDGRYIQNLPKPQLLTKASKSMSITNTNLLSAPVLITAVMSELVSNRKMYSLILASAT